MYLKYDVPSIYIENKICTQVAKRFGAHESVIVVFISRIAKLRGKQTTE